MNKFKVGDIVVCVNNPKLKTTKGAGFKLGLKYRIRKIAHGNNSCYFGGMDDYGVFEPFLILVKEFNWRKLVEGGYENV